MKRLFAIFLALALCFTATPAIAEVQDMLAYVYSWDGKQSADGKPVLTRITSGITFKVLAVDSDTSETIYEPSDQDSGALTSLTNPVTTTNFNSATVCNDRVAFRVDPTDATNDRYVDLIVVDTAGGYTQFVENFDKYTRTIVLDERPNMVHHGMIWYTDTTTDETDTGIDFDYDTMILGVAIEEVSGQTGGSITVGLLSTETSGDADGLLVGTSTVTAGYPLITLATSGALMDDATNFDPNGHTVVSANARSLSYTMYTTGDEANGYIHYRFIRNR